MDENGLLVIEALPSFIASLQSMTFHVDLMYWSPASVARIVKYVAKGFECCVPGTRRAAFKESTADRSMGAYNRRRGLNVLFDAEADVLRSRSYWQQTPEELAKKGEDLHDCIEKILGRLEMCEAAAIASKTAYKLGHGHDSKMEPSREADFEDFEEDFEDNFFYAYGASSNARTNTYRYIRESFRRDVAVRLSDERRGMKLGMTFWTLTDAGRFKVRTQACTLMHHIQHLLGMISNKDSQRALLVNINQ